MNCTKEQVTDFHKGVNSLEKHFDKKLQVNGEDLAKAVETINSSISKDDNRLSKKIDEVEAKVVAEAMGTVKEIVVTAATNKKVTSFVTCHLKEYFDKFFKSLLDANSVAFAEDVDIF